MLRMKPAICRGRPWVPRRCWIAAFRSKQRCSRSAPSPHWRSCVVRTDSSSAYSSGLSSSWQSRSLARSRLRVRISLRCCVGCSYRESPTAVSSWCSHSLARRSYPTTCFSTPRQQKHGGQGRTILPQREPTQCCQWVSAVSSVSSSSRQRPLVSSHKDSLHATPPTWRFSSSRCLDPSQNIYSGSDCSLQASAAR